MQTTASQHSPRALPDSVSESLDELAKLGAQPRGGVTRVAWSPELFAAYEWVGDRMRALGLEVEVDAAGNMLGHTAGTEPEGSVPAVWTGSHLDSVPQGGKFDGALGVVAAIEAVERVGHGTVVVFRDEERGCAGSRALVARGGPFPKAFLEVHIEQGPRLADAGAPLGIVTGIVGYARGEVVVEGTAGHAGTTPMDVRDDALVKASRAILRLEEEASRIPGSVATVGRIAAEPGGSNVIPGRVRYSVDVRAPDQERLDALIELAGIDYSHAVQPVEMNPLVVEALRAEVEDPGLQGVELSSGAGHDAGVLARAGIPSGMLFVRSLNDGVSHSPDELSSGEDVALAIDVLAGALARL